MRKSIGPSLKNEFGEHNCFLNVIIHTLYNIKEIRTFFLVEDFKQNRELNIFSELGVKIFLIL